MPSVLILTILLHKQIHFSCLSVVCKICAGVYEVNVCVAVGIFGYSGYFENSSFPNVYVYVNVCVTTGAGSGLLLTDGLATLFSPCICSLPFSLFTFCFFSFSLSFSLSHAHTLTFYPSCSLLCLECTFVLYLKTSYK